VKPVEAGDRALETARKICDLCQKWLAQDNDELGEIDIGADVLAALIRDAMNAQERELREALRECSLILRTMDGGFVSQSEIQDSIAEANRLLGR
jgi:hypothetical protein